MLIGYLHHRKEPRHPGRAYAFAAVAKAEGADLLYFSPGAVNGDSINGYLYNNGEWTRTASRLPDVVYNTTGGSRQRQIEAVEELEKAAPFTSHSVGDKLTVYRNLKKEGKFADYLIPSETAASPGHVLSYLERYKKIVVKPSSGRQGENVYCVTARDGGLLSLIEQKIKEEEYIVQPYINCRTKAGEPYDFRLHTQKGRDGEWLTSCIYPRISPSGGIVCNISQGGYTCGLKDFLDREFGPGGFDTRKYLEVFSLQLSSHLDEIQRRLYDEELDELGIDVGLDENKKLYIYEVNWRPGHPPLMNMDLSVIRNTVLYAVYLAERKKGGLCKRSSS